MRLNMRLTLMEDVRGEREERRIKEKTNRKKEESDHERGRRGTAKRD